MKSKIVTQKELFGLVALGCMDATLNNCDEIFELSRLGLVQYRPNMSGGAWHLGRMKGMPYGNNEDVAKTAVQLKTCLAAIKTFCKESEWCSSAWKEQSHIKPLFDLMKENE